MKGSIIVRYSRLLAVLPVLLPVTSWAAGSCTGALTAEQIRNCLTAPLVTRGITMRSRGITVEGQPAPAQENSVNLTVNFEFNSAQLSNDGMISLDALGTALSAPDLRDQRFRIAGHTDAVGSDDYNQKLSEARALAVLAYLSRTRHLDANNFDVVGFGKTQLYDPNDPTAAINRRVEVTKLSR
jgi:outer membrane protein OmpA-like peptidoglycan-associated protein